MTLRRLPLRVLMWVLDALHVHGDCQRRPWVLCADCRAYQRGIWWLDEEADHE